MNYRESIIAYLSNELNEADMAQFEAELAKNPDLAQETAEIREIIAGIEQVGTDKLRDDMRQITHKLESEGFFEKNNPVQQRNHLSIYRIIGMAAAISAFAFGVWLLLRPKPVTKIVENQSVVPQKIDSLPAVAPVTTPAPGNTEVAIQKQEKPAPKPAEPNYIAMADELYDAPSFSGLRRGDAQQTVVDSAFLLYRTHQFEKLIALIDKTDFDPKFSTQMEVLKGHAFLGLHDYKKARPVFKKIVDSQTLPFSEESEYYLLLCYFSEPLKYQSEFSDLSKKILSDPQHPDFEKTQQLAVEMQKIKNF